MAGTTGVIILAGGKGRRMGGVDKASITVHGERLIDRQLRQLPYGTPTVVVSPYPLGMPQLCERPAFGGPVAGIAVGYEALKYAPGVTHIAVLSVDAPDSPLALPDLHAALGRAPVVVTSQAGRVQPICALWKKESLGHALERIGEPRNQPAMRLVRAAGPFAVTPSRGFDQDLDTQKDVERFAAALGTSRRQ